MVAGSRPRPGTARGRSRCRRRWPGRASGSRRRCRRSGAARPRAAAAPRRGPVAAASPGHGRSRGCPAAPPGPRRPAPRPARPGAPAPPARWPGHRRRCSWTSAAAGRPTPAARRRAGRRRSSARPAGRGCPRRRATALAATRAPQEGPAGERRQLLQAGGEQPPVAAELVDHEAGHLPLVVRLEQGKGPEQGGEHPATVDVPDQQHRQPGGPGQPHVGEVVAAQVDLGRAPGPLADHHLVARAEGGQAVEHDLAQLRLERLVAQRVHLAPRPAEHDHLRMGVAARLEQDRVHQRRRGDPGGGGLDRLGAADLGPVRGDGAVERHVLRLERGHRDPLPRQPPAEAGDDHGLAGVAVGAGDEQGAIHRAGQRVGCRATPSSPAVDTGRSLP